MDKRGKFNIDESRSEMTITFSWYTHVAIFLIFFCLMWNGIIGTMASTLLFAGDVPILFAFFLIPFVGVGIGLIYYTLCLVINKTTITVDNNRIKVKSTPLPWWKSNKELDVSDVKQFYVKETANRSSKGSTTYTYALQVLMNNDSNIELISGSVLHNADDAAFLEQKIENYLGIEDFKVRGEYDASAKPNFSDVARFIKQQVNPTNITLENLSKGAILDYKMKTWEVAYALQYDWSNGQMDNLYQLLNGTDNMLLYIKKEMALFTPYTEEKGNYFDIDQLPEDTNFGKLPVQFDYKGKTYRKEGSYGGKVFSEEAGTRRGTALIQSFYQTADKRFTVRLEQKRNASISVFLGEKTEAFEFSNILPN